jgi:zinc D-Ala-D-Ala carboxypeptidase
MDWSKYPNFSEEEFRCKHTGLCEMQPATMARIQRLRTLYGKPLRVTSGYRHSTHPVEAAKPAPGVHTQGRAVDLAVEGVDAFQVVRLALRLGFTGIGVQQKGPGRFIHLDDSPGPLRPRVWSY